MHSLYSSKNTLQTAVIDLLLLSTAMLYLRQNFGAARLTAFYKLLVWCDNNNNIVAEYISVPHNNKVRTCIVYTTLLNMCIVITIHNNYVPLSLHLMQPVISHQKSTDRGKDVQQIQNAVTRDTGITFNLGSLQCNPSTGVFMQVTNLQQVIL